MTTLLAYGIVFGLEYLAIRFIFQTGLVFSGLTVWLFPTVGIMLGALWWVMLTNSILSAIPMLAVTYFAARSGLRVRRY